MTILWVRELLRRIAFCFNGSSLIAILPRRCSFTSIASPNSNARRGCAEVRESDAAEGKKPGCVGWSAVEQFFQDLRHAVRGMKQAPAFTGAALLTLTLGIGVNAAVFGLVHAVLLRDLPYRDSSRLMVGRMSIPDYQDLRESTKVFDDAAIWASNQYRAHIDGEAEQVLGAIVSDRFFPMMGDAALGRTFSTSDARQPVAVISHSLWTTRFGATPSVLGKSLRLNDEVFTIIGVMPGLVSERAPWQWVPLEHAMGAIPADAEPRLSNLPCSCSSTE